jgi:hypothetical protein
VDGRGTTDDKHSHDALDTERTRPTVDSTTRTDGCRATTRRPAGVAMNVYRHVDGAGTTCEDLANATDAGAWVLDGASGAERAGVTDAPTDGRWYVERLDAYLDASLSADAPLPEVVREGVSVLESAYHSFEGSHDTGILGHPLAAGALVRFDDEYIEYLLSADCSLAVERADGTVETVLGDGPRTLDQRVVDEIRRRKADGLTHEAAKRATRSMIVDNRRELNRPGGYWALSFDERAVDHARGSTLSTADVDGLALFSDGFERLTEQYDALTYEALFETVRAEGPEPLFERLRRIERDDDDCTEYPRIKPQDDAALLVVDVDA